MNMTTEKLIEFIRSNDKFAVIYNNLNECEQFVNDIKYLNRNSIVNTIEEGRYLPIIIKYSHSIMCSKIISLSESKCYGTNSDEFDLPDFFSHIRKLKIDRILELE